MQTDNKSKQRVWDFFFPWINFGLFLQPQSLSTPFLISYIWPETNPVTTYANNRIVSFSTRCWAFLRWSGLFQVCSLSPALAFCDRSLWGGLRYPQLIFVIWQTTFQTFLDQLPGTQGMVSREDWWPPTAGVPQMLIVHRYYHTVLTPTRPCQHWLSNFYSAILGQEFASCFGIRLCHSTGRKKRWCCWLTHDKHADRKSLVF